MLFSPPKFLGLVLDVSLRTVDGRKIADGVRNELVDFVDIFDDEDQLYLSTNTSTKYDRDDIVATKGKRIAVIGNWRPKEVAPRLIVELSKALHAVTIHGDIDGEWYICLITDRYKPHDDKYLSQIMNQNADVWGEAEITVVTIGDHYDFKEYEELCKVNACKHIHLKTPSGIKSILSEWMKLEN